MDRADEAARELLRLVVWVPVHQADNTIRVLEDLAVKDVAAALRQARGDIEGEVCPHWMPGLAKLVSVACRLVDNPEIAAAADEIDMLIEQAEAKT